MLELIRHDFPDLEIHASTQMSSVNVKAAQFLQSQGVTRVVPAREISLEEIQEIYRATGMEDVYKRQPRMQFTEKPFQRLRNAGRKAVLRLKWNVHLCWQFHNTGRFHLYNFCMGRIVSVLSLIHICAEEKGLEKCFFNQHSIT